MYFGWKWCVNVGLSMVNKMYVNVGLSMVSDVDKGLDYLFKSKIVLQKVFVCFLNT